MLGRGGAGKSTCAGELARITGLPALELDKYFWGEDLAPLPVERWVVRQEELAAGEAWIMDGDLGPYDAPAARLRYADTVVILDLSLLRCAWRAARRDRAGWGFWLWLLTWRWRSRRRLLRMVATHARHARVSILRTPTQVHRFLAVAAETSP